MKGGALEGWVKICGIRTVSDAGLCFDAGADAIGINLWPGSPRSVSLGEGSRIAEAVRGRGTIVGVTVDASPEEVAAIFEAMAPDFIQLHGDEEPGPTEGVRERVYKAVGLGSAQDVTVAKGWPGPFVLVDARDEVARGGTGRAPPGSLAAEVCGHRPTVLAGGLNPENVGAAIRSLRPVGVDTASGVETAPGVKCPEKVRRFVAAAREAFRALPPASTRHNP